MRSARRRTRDRRRPRLALLVGAVLLVAGCGAPVIVGSAQPLPASPDVTPILLQDSGGIDLVKKFNESPQVVNAYWTPDRMRHAHPNSPPPPEEPAPTAPSTASTVPSNAVPSTAVPSSPTATTTTTKVPKTTEAPTTTKAPTTTEAPKTTKAPASTKARTSHTTRAAPKTTRSRRSSPKPRPAPTAKAPSTQLPRDSNGNLANDPSGVKVKVNSKLTPSSAGHVFGKPGISKSTSGRLYYKFGDEDWVCSGTVVSSKSMDIVATAGHCVFDTEGGKGFGSDYLFIPDDANNGESSPYGRWTAIYLTYSKDFVATARASRTRSWGQGWAYDYAFLKMAPVNGQRIQQVTGGQGIAFGIPVTSLMVIGYPSAPPFDGTSERYCAANSWAAQPNIYGDRSIPCTMTPGCSGGAWLADFNPVTGGGYLIGATSVTGHDGNGRPILNTAYWGSGAQGSFLDAIAGHV